MLHRPSPSPHADGGHGRRFARGERSQDPHGHGPKWHGGGRSGLGRFDNNGRWRPRCGPLSTQSGRKTVLHDGHGPSPQSFQGASSASNTARANKGGFCSIAKWDTPGRINRCEFGMVSAMYRSWLCLMASS